MTINSLFMYLGDTDGLNEYTSRFENVRRNRPLSNLHERKDLSDLMWPL
jgi:hypothetical protein